MNKKITKMIALALAVLMLGLALTGCSPKQSAEPGKQENPENTLKGSISLAGSTSMEKLCEAMIESFMDKYKDITVTCEYTGSGAGLESLIAGSTDIGNSSRNLKSGEKEKGAVENIVAIDGIAVIVGKDNAVANLSTEQLVDIFSGKTTNWKELGGNDEAIVVIGRENGSGTRSAFEELLKLTNECQYAQELDSTGGVLAKVAAIPGSIGYVSLDVVDKTVHSLALNGVDANESNIVAGKYLLSRPFVMATMGEISSQNELVKTWFAYISSAEGQKIIKTLGLILPQ